MTAEYKSNNSEKLKTSKQKQSKLFLKGGEFLNLHSFLFLHIQWLPIQTVDCSLLLFPLYCTAIYCKLHTTPFLPQFITSRLLYDVPITIHRNFINIYDILNHSRPTNCRYWQPISLKYQQSSIAHALLKIEVMFQKLSWETTYCLFFYFVNSYDNSNFLFLWSLCDIKLMVGP